jgi:hypothetical protein
MKFPDIQASETKKSHAGAKIPAQSAGCGPASGRIPIPPAHKTSPKGKPPPFAGIPFWETFETRRLKKVQTVSSLEKITGNF